MRSFQQILLSVCIIISPSFLLGITDDVNIPEKKIVILIPSYNNQKWYVHNLASVLSQNYTNFRVIYIDDCSPDSTGTLVEEYLVDNDPDHKVSLIKNSVRHGALHNLYRAIHACDDDDIIVTVDGDDWFPDNDKNVLQRLNAVYSSDEIWMTYGQFQWISGLHGWAAPYSPEIIKNNAFRGIPEIPTHLRTFYAWLFKKIKLNDLLYMGRFYPMAWDTAFLFPMIEMAGERHQFISDVMYVYNEDTTINDHVRNRQLQMYLAQILIYKERYNRLAEKPTKRDKHTIIKSDAILFSESPAQLMQLLSSLNTYVDGIDQIFVLYAEESLQERDEYNALRALYPDVKFYVIDEYRSNFRNILLFIYRKITNDYVLFAKGDAIFQKSLCLNDCINALEDTAAFAFYFKRNAQDVMHKHLNVPLVECNDDIYAWNFGVAVDSDQWSSANSIDCVIHKRDNVFSFIARNNFRPTPNGIECEWANEGKLDRIGLCFGESYVAAI